MTFSIILDLLVAVLLVVTISYAVVLNRKLVGLRRDKAELERLTASFGKATQRAGDSALKLKSTADALQDGVGKAQALRDDLRFLIDRGVATADRLEEGVRATRKTAGPAAVAAPDKRPRERAAAARREENLAPATEAERQLLKVLQAAR